MVNDVSREGVGFDSDRNAVTIITHSEVIEVPETTKWEVAQRVLDQAVRLRKVATGSGSRQSLPNQDFRLLILDLRLNTAPRHEDVQSEIINLKSAIAFEIPHAHNPGPATQTRTGRPHPLLQRTRHLRFLPARDHCPNPARRARTIAQSQSRSCNSAVSKKSCSKSPPSPSQLFADPAQGLRAIREDIGDCTRCRLAKQGRKQIVFGVGNPQAELMFIGEAPGADEDQQGEPFVGRAGQLLNNMIKAMGLRREDIYIANIIKCRPPGNRTPERDECETCSPFLMRQIAAIKPKVIVALGAVAAKTLLAINAPMSELRGQVVRLPRHQACRDLPSCISAARSPAKERSLERFADGNEGSGAGGSPRAPKQRARSRLPTIPHCSTSVGARAYIDHA